MAKLLIPLCPMCSEQVSPLGDFVRERGRSVHIHCFLRPKIDEAINAHDVAIIQEAADRKRAEQDREAAKREELQASLQKLKAKGKALWTRDDRQKLVEAKLICVHCGDRPPTIGKHCSPCYTASQYGETQTAAASAKSAQGIEAAAQVLAGAKGPPPSRVCSTAQCDRVPLEGQAKCEGCKAAEKPRDRFGVIEMD